MAVSLLQVLAYSSCAVAFRSSKRDFSQLRLESESGTGGGIAFPAGGNCAIGSGHSSSRGCDHAGAAETVYNCEEDDTESICIKEEDITLDANGYNRFTRTTEEWNALTKVVADAEAAGYGASVSVGVDYLKSSKSSESSIGFFCGSSQVTRHRYIQNYGKLKWTDAAKFMLKWSPATFASMFGTGYVYKIEYGGSFLGSFTLTSRTTESQDSLKVFANIAVEQPRFDAKLGAAFNQAKAKVASNISVYASAKWSGGSPLKQDFSDPGTVGKMFTDWSDSLPTAPVPLTLVERGWADSHDFIITLMTLDAAKQHEALRLFMDLKATRGWRSELAQESVKLSFLAETVGRALNLKENEGKQNCLIRIRRKIVAAVTAIRTLDDITAKMEESESLDSDLIQFFKLSAEWKRC